MADWSPTIANEFIRRAKAAGNALTQMQLQKLVYISHGWNLAINGVPLTFDDPQAWDYGPVYRNLWQALKQYGQGAVTKEILYGDYMPGVFAEQPSTVAIASLTEGERAIIDRVYRDYGRFHAFKLSALTHQPGTPWSEIYSDGRGKYDDIPTDLIKDHFVNLARSRTAPSIA